MRQKFGIVALYSWVKAACRALVYFFYYKQYFEKKLSFFFKMDPLVALLFGPPRSENETRCTKSLVSSHSTAG